MDIGEMLKKQASSPMTMGSEQRSSISGSIVCIQDQLERVAKALHALEESLMPVLSNMNGYGLREEEESLGSMNLSSDVSQKVMQISAHLSSLQRRIEHITARVEV